MNFFDLHADVPLKISEDMSCESSVDLYGKSFEKYAQFAAIWLNDGDSHPIETYEQMRDNFVCYLNKNGLKLSLPGRKDGIFLSLENGGFLSEYPKYLDKLQSDGVRLISLSWNGENSLAGGCRADCGFSEKGIQIIKRMNEKHMVLDISHLNKRSAKRAIEVADYVIASHSCCSKVFKHTRNLDDDILLKIREKGGLVGICFYPEFLGAGDVFFKIKENIDHLIDLSMHNNISIGTDFDGAVMDKKLSKSCDLPKLYCYLSKFSYGEELLNKIFYLNALDFFAGVCNY